MSNNPFEDLAVHLESLNNEGNNFYVALSNLSNNNWSSLHAKILQTLFEAKELAQAINTDPDSLALIDEIHQTLIQYHSDWRSVFVKIPSRDIAMLRLIGKDVNAHGLLPARLTHDRQQALRKSLENMLDYVTRNPSNLPEESLGFLRYLLKRCLELLDGEDMDLVALRSISTQAAGLATPLSTMITDQEERDSFLSNCGSIFQTWVVPIVTGTTSTILASATISLLGS